ncbi:hypothetical protein NPA31_017720 [Aurantimonas sp. MSK8Z-1]|uniref:hypothetical protein n=1 Tax=Mangrovibrevibacter kandeliae TaxID=2968473 RepID=UPI0021175289|nr:hypothetical protein [Aurantimonas sp. MSK8Z-1]MCW4116801.1 hypothetical protein [Aurantimonas sp. MSK8Z-1]
MSLADPVATELAKLTATFVNSIAAGLAVVGGVGPVVNALNLTSTATDLVWLLVASCLCVGAALSPQLGARAYLRRELRK